MRRKEREVTDYNKMIEILKLCDCCRIGLVDDKGAYIVPMNFGYEDNNGKLTLYFHGATEGKKIDLINNQPEISFETDTKHELVTSDTACGHSYLYQSIMGRGQVKIVADRDTKIKDLIKSCTTIQANPILNLTKMCLNVQLL